MTDVRTANDGFYVALNAAFNGDAAPMHEVWSQADDITLLGPFGGCLVGPADVVGQFDGLVAAGMGGHVEPIDVRIIQGADIGYALGVEEGHNIVDGERVPTRHRFTSAFRLENGRWRMIHHHTDLAPNLGEVGVAASTTT